MACQGPPPLKGTEDVIVGALPQTAHRSGNAPYDADFAVSKRRTQVKGRQDDAACPSGCAAYNGGLVLA